jgi:NAD(P)-dependent dehydrogenase (short-subunit alcohol dehydrogenase family)
MEKSIIVTGGASGIGLEIAKTALENGYQVGIIDSSESNLENAMSKSKAIKGIAADITNQKEVEHAFDELGSPTTVVNNAGIVRFGALIDQPVEDFVAAVNVNLIGTYIVSRTAAKRMAGEGGHIINITSINSITPGPNAGAYPSTKAGVRQLTRQLAIELANTKIRVNSIAPGFIDAGMSTPIYEDNEIRRKRSEAVPSGRLGTAQDIAQAIMFLDSKEGSYVNGHEFVIDGGVVHSLLNQLPRD